MEVALSSTSNNNNMAELDPESTGSAKEPAILADSETTQPKVPMNISSQRDVIENKDHVEETDPSHISMDEPVLENNNCRTHTSTEVDMGVSDQPESHINHVEFEVVKGANDSSDLLISDSVGTKAKQLDSIEVVIVDDSVKTSSRANISTRLEANGVADENEAPQTKASHCEIVSDSSEDSSSSESCVIVSGDEEEQTADCNTAKLSSPKCEVCRSCSAKYTCPRCELKTCSVPCVKQHKVRTGCSGERDKLAFVDMSQYSDQHLLNDYRFLEDAERRLFSNTSAPSSHRRQAVRFMPYINRRCKFLMNAAHKRGINLRFVNPALTKNKNNTSFFTISTDTIDWHVDWLFSSSNTLVKDEKVAETTVLIQAVRKFTNFTEYPHLRKSLELYKGDNLNSCHFLLKLDGLPANRPRYFALKPELSLAENLKGMCLIEYPTIVLVPPCDAVTTENYPLLSKEDMPKMDRDSSRHMLQYHPHLRSDGEAEKQLLDINSSLYAVSQSKQPAQIHA